MPGVSILPIFPSREFLDVVCVVGLVATQSAPTKFSIFLIGDGFAAFWLGLLL